MITRRTALLGALAMPAFGYDTRPRPRPDVIEAQASGEFAAYLAGVRGRAIAAGIQPGVFDAAVRNISLNGEVIRLSRSQAEFTKQIWEYLDTAVSDSRINNGRQKFREWQTTLSAIERRYGVEASICTAVWGIETSYGGFMGNTNVIEALATLGYEGRRRAFAEEQLIEALKILQRGDTTPDRMIGSWAGAMGHTQFIPTSYQSYAQDFDGDGRRDVWNPSNPTDALASTANYLARFGWTLGQPWGIEVALPAAFDYAQADQNNRQSVRFWAQRGVVRVDGTGLPDYGEAGLLAPAGARGPKFLVFNNFRVIKRYNNATSYAMAVGHLAGRIIGRPAFQAGWPRGDQPLSRTQKMELQRLLAARGFNPGPADGVIGPNTINAVRAYQRAAGLVPDGYVSTDLLTRLR